MDLTAEEKAMIAGEFGKATQKALEILLALGTIYHAEKLVPVESVQISGVSYDNLGDAGLGWLQEMAEGGGKARVLTTLNPAGMDIEDWETLGISQDFAKHQIQVIQAYSKMGIIPTCTCTPYLIGNLPQFGAHIAWAESSAVCYANSVIGARTNREGGPGALAAALTGRTPEYGYHLVINRQPQLTVFVKAKVSAPQDFGALGKLIGSKIESSQKKIVPYIQGIREASLESLKSFSASIATYGGTALFHMDGITPEASLFKPPETSLVIDQLDLEQATHSLTDSTSEEIDFLSLGCPHLSIKEIARIAELLDGKKVTKEFWITTSRSTRLLADQAGYTKIIQTSGAKFAVDTCCVVAPIKGRFHTMATDSAKACYYASGKNKFKTVFLPFDQVVLEALK